MKRKRISYESRVSAFTRLGEVMREGAAGRETGPAGRFSHLIETLRHSNPWFTPDNVRRAVSAIGDILTEEKFEKWLSAYPELHNESPPATVGVVMAGNIPLAGFHDLLCVLITGNRLQAKLSSKDEPLIKAVTDTLILIEPRMADHIEIAITRLHSFDMVIATGSNNSSRYFEYYFRNVPHIIRHNRNSLAILDGTESDEELDLLADDIFTYFGLGCRNVSKLLLPHHYNPDSLIRHWHRWSSLLSHHKYSVNYDHNKAVMMINRERFTDGGFMLMRESSSLAAPMAVLNYEYYSPESQPKTGFLLPEDQLQCVTGHGQIPFGNTQKPELWDYADKINTIDFLLLKKNG